MSKFTTILHEKRKEANMSMNEYVLTDTIHHLSRDRWCNMSRETMANEFWLTKPWIIKIVDRLCLEWWIEKGVKWELKTTYKWEELIYTNGKQSIPEVVNKVIQVGKQSIPNIYIDNNIDNNSENTITETIVSKPKKVKDERALALIDSFKEIIKKQWYIYSSPNETVNAGKIVKNKEWQEVCYSYGKTTEEMIVYIMTYANSDICWWKGKICSIQSFYYRWAALLSEMKTKGIQLPKNTFPDEGKKKEALDFFNDI
jgi:hypothetical protein